MAGLKEGNPFRRLWILDVYISQSLSKLVRTPCQIFEHLHHDTTALFSLYYPSHQSLLLYLTNSIFCIWRYTMIPASLFLGFTAALLWVAEVNFRLRLTLLYYPHHKLRIKLSGFLFPCPGHIHHLCSKKLRSRNKNNGRECHWQFQWSILGFLCLYSSTLLLKSSQLDRHC